MDVNINSKKSIFPDKTIFQSFAQEWDNWDLKNKGKIFGLKKG
jgi:hypothetical protein